MGLLCPGRYREAAEAQQSISLAACSKVGNHKLPVTIFPWGATPVSMIFPANFSDMGDEGWENRVASKFWPLAEWEDHNLMVNKSRLRSLYDISDCSLDRIVTSCSVCKWTQLTRLLALTYRSVFDTRGGSMDCMRSVFRLIFLLWFRLNLLDNQVYVYMSVEMCKEFVTNTKTIFHNRYNLHKLASACFISLFMQIKTILNELLFCEICKCSNFLAHKSLLPHVYTS